MLWLGFIIASAILFSFASLLQKILLKRKEINPLAFSVLFQLLVSSLIFTYLFFFGHFNLPSNFRELVPFLLISAGLYSGATLFQFKSLKDLDVSDSTIINSSKVLWTTLSAMIFLRERLPAIAFLGIFFILTGIIIIFYQKKKLSFDKAHLYALLSALCFGLAFTNDARLLRYFDALSYTALGFLIPSVILSTLSPRSLKHLKVFADHKLFPKMLLVSFIYGLSAIFFYLSFRKGGQASQIMSISQLSIVVTIVLAFVFLKERKRLLQKIAGASIVILGVWLLI